MPGDDIPDVPAPGLARLIQSFASTLGDAPAADPLATRDAAAAWLQAESLLPAGMGLSSSDHGALLRLRESLRDVLAARAAGHDDGDAAARLTKALADGRLVLTVDAAGAVGLASAARASYSGVVAAIAVALAKSAVGTWPRLTS